jgi:iron complex outermembrane receptor protein
MKTILGDRSTRANRRRRACHPRRLLAQRATLALLLSAASEASLAQSASPGSTVVLDEVVVAGRRDGVPVSIRERFDAIPGGVAIVGAEEYADTARPTLSRALANVPGVIVQDFFGGNDQPRVQIRGSGLQQNPVERGVLMLQDGLPINRADGSYIVGFANPRQADSIEVYRGYTANRLGATVHGGALNFTSPTGSTQPGARLALSGGSFGQGDVAGQGGMRRDNLDALVQFDVDRRDGYRDHNSSQRVNVAGNLGVAHSANATTRIFAGYTDLEFDVAGPLPKDAMYANPRQVHTGPTVTPSGPVNPGPNVIRDRPQRKASQFIIGSRTTATFAAHLVDFGIGYTYTDDTFRFPISSGIRSTDGGDFTVLARYAYNPQAAVLPLFEATAQYTIGKADRGYEINQAGGTGASFGESDLEASTLSLSAGFNIALGQGFTLSPAISFARATRDNDDTYDRPTRPTIAFNPANPTVSLPNGAVPAQDTSYSRSYDAWSPSLALSYRPDRAQFLFAAASRSFEPPTHDDLIAPINGTPNSSAGRPAPPNPALPAAAFATPDLEAQTATTIEGGWRGRTDRFTWDVVTYYSWLEDELLSLRDATGAPLGAINADRTTHFGVELGAGWRITDALYGQLAYTYQDFRFDDDPLRGDNRLAGAPPHLVYAALQWQANDRWSLQGAVRWVPSKTPVDNLNTLYADRYVVVDLRTEYVIDKTFTLFGEITNVFDETYASSTLVVDQTRPDQAAFLPADGRAFYAGVRIAF